MKFTLVGLIMSVFLSGCASLEDSIALLNDESSTEVDKRLLRNTTYPLANPLESSHAFQQQFQRTWEQEETTEVNADLTPAMEIAHRQNQQLVSTQNINYYARGIMQDLVANLQYVNKTTPVAIVSFVMLDGDYNDSNLLGIQMAESLMHEVHKFGIPVIDFKTTGFIRVTEQGDFAFSKDYEDFKADSPARYIVGGTMLKISDGYLINARIVGVKSKAVVASAQSFIPNNVTDSILMQASVETPENPQALSMSKTETTKVTLIQD